LIRPSQPTPSRTDQLPKQPVAPDDFGAATAVEGEEEGMKPDRNCGSGDGGEIATLHAEVLEVSLASDRSRDDMLEFKDSDAQVLWSLAIAESVR
jgi:hypothetical protein